MSHLEVALVAGVQGGVQLLEKDCVGEGPHLRLCIEVDNSVGPPRTHLLHFLHRGAIHVLPARMFISLFHNNDDGTTS